MRRTSAQVSDAVMLFGDRPGSIARVERYAVHGDPMLRMWITFDDAPATAEPVLLGPEAVDDALVAGDRVTATIVAGVAAALRRAGDG